MTRIRKHSYQGHHAARALAGLKSPATFSAVVGGLGLAVLGVALIVRAEERGQSVYGGFTVMFGLLAATRDTDGQGLWGRVRGPVFALAGQALITSLYAGGGAFASTTDLWPVRLIASALLLLSVAFALTGSRQDRD